MGDGLAERFEASLPSIKELLLESGAKLAYLFGSASRGRERADSDLDIAVLLGREIPVERHGEVRLRLTTELVGLTHVNDVDLVILNSAPPLLADQVITTGRLIFGERAEQVPFEVNTIKRYIDTRALRERLEEALRRRIQRGAAAAGREMEGRW